MTVNVTNSSPLDHEYDPNWDKSGEIWLVYLFMIIVTILLSVIYHPDNLGIAEAQEVVVKQEVVMFKGEVRKIGATGVKNFHADGRISFMPIK